MSFAILRFEKRTGGTIRAIESHHERKKEAYTSNPDIEIEKSKYNYHLLKPQSTYYQEIHKRISEAGCKVRSNSIKFVDVMITSDCDFFNKNSESEYFNRAFNFMCDKIGKQNVVSAVVHLDEKTPHMHLCFVPITNDNRLTAKEILGNKAKLSKWQDEFHSYMQQQFERLERGKSARDTKRKHIPIQLFKDATRLSDQLYEIEQALKDINIINAPKKRDKAIELLKIWFPQASTFISEIDKLQNNIEDFKEKENEMTAEIERLGEINHEQLNDFYRKQGNYRIENEKLLNVIKSCKKFMSLIPKPIYNQVYKEYEKQLEIEQYEQDIDNGYELDDD